MDLAIADRGTRAQRDQLLALRQRMHVGTVIAPPSHRIGGARTVRTGQQVLVGSLVVEVTSHDPHLAVAVTPPSGTALVRH